MTITHDCAFHCKTIFLTHTVSAFPPFFYLFLIHLWIFSYLFLISIYSKALIIHRNPTGTLALDGFQLVPSQNNHIEENALCQL